MSQKGDVELDRQWWNRLRKFSEAGDVQGFYATYAEYLEWRMIVSERREILRRMARLAAGLAAREPPT